MGPHHVKPNYFLGLRITSPSVVENIARLQAELIAKHNTLEKHLESPNKSHVTLAVLNLNEQSVEDCKTALKTFKPSYSDQERTVGFSGLGLFSKRVIFAKPSANIEFLETLRRDLLEILNGEDIPVLEEDREFNPHLTLFKIRRERKRKKSGEDKKKNKLDIEEDKDNYSDYSFGEQVFDELELLSMNKPKAEDGYYFSEAKFSLVENQ